MAIIASSKELSVADFAPLLRRDGGPQKVRPSLSYWQDAWHRLMADRSAAVSLWIIIGLIVFTLAGPSLLGVDPSSQDLSQISRAPSLQPKAELVANSVD